LEVVPSVYGKITSCLVAAAVAAVTAAPSLTASAQTTDASQGDSAKSQNISVPERPNIIVFVTDDQRKVTSVMPNVRHYFKEEGRRFPHAFATTPVCCPSRASIMTGQYAHNHGVLSNRPGVVLDNFVERDTIQKHLQSIGYRTGIVGKFLNGYDSGKDPRYFDSYAIPIDDDYYDPVYNIDGQSTQVQGYTTDFMREWIHGFLDNPDPRPWYLYVSVRAPHNPYQPSPQYADAPVPEWKPSPAVFERNKSDKPFYVREASHTYEQAEFIRTQQLRTLMSVDDLVADLFSRLESRGESSDTLAFFVSDNGYMWGEHGLIAKDVPYTPSVEVPFFMRWPGHVEPGSSDSRLVGNIDIAPTIFEALGVPGPDVDGRNLLDSSWDRSRIILEHWCNVNGCNRWASLRTHTRQYVEYYDSEGNTTFREFYNLSEDPDQLRNVLHDGIPGNAPNVERWSEELRWAKACGAQSWACP
jgi:arylsulfatase A-like enzyme